MAPKDLQKGGYHRDARGHLDLSLSGFTNDGFGLVLELPGGPQAPLRRSKRSLGSASRVAPGKKAGHARTALPLKPERSFRT